MLLKSFAVGSFLVSAWETDGLSGTANEINIRMLVKKN